MKKTFKLIILLLIASLLSYGLFCLLENTIYFLTWRKESIILYSFLLSCLVVGYAYTFINVKYKEHEKKEKQKVNH